MPETSRREQREHPRYRVDLRVDCSTRDAFLSSHVTNLSRGGVFIEGAEGVPVGTEVELVLALPPPHAPMHVRGRVIWTFDIRIGGMRVVPGMGIKFLDLTAEQHRLLGDVLATLAPPAATHTPAPQATVTARR